MQDMPQFVPHASDAMGIRGIAISISSVAIVIGPMNGRSKPTIPLKPTTSCTNDARQSDPCIYIGEKSRTINRILNLICLIFTKRTN